VSDLVKLRHPDLPADQTITVDRRRVGPRLAAGWEEVTPEKAPESPAAPESDQPTKSTRRSRNTTEEQ
jgi:hypothetical protein